MSDEETYTEPAARASAVAGNRAEALKYLQLAGAAGQVIGDDQSKQFLLGDMNGDNWYGLK